jgi:predicted Zn-dependent peptidase
LQIFLADELTKLKKLEEEGVLTAQEFEAAKQRLLNNGNPNS